MRTKGKCINSHAQGGVLYLYPVFCMVKVKTLGNSDIGVSFDCCKAI